MSGGTQVIEAMLLSWSESPAGRKVTFLLPAEPDHHPFRGLKAGPAHGQRLALSVALIGDDETQEDVQKPAGKSFAQRAGILCGKPAFYKFLTQMNLMLAFEASGHGDPDAEAAAYAIRKICGVESRKDLIDGTPAGRKFLELERDFNLWMRGHG